MGRHHAVAVDDGRGHAFIGRRRAAVQRGLVKDAGQARPLLGLVDALVMALRAVGVEGLVAGGLLGIELIDGNGCGIVPAAGDGERHEAEPEGEESAPARLLEGFFHLFYSRIAPGDGCCQVNAGGAKNRERQSRSATGDPAVGYSAA